MQSNHVNGLSADANPTQGEHKDNIFKRILMALNKLDLDDFIISIFRSVFSEKIVKILGPFIVGGLSLFGLINEGWDGIKEACSAYQNETCPQRKTKIVTGALSFAAGVTGIALVLAYIAGGLGATVLGFGYMPFIIPALLTNIYGFALWRRSYVLNIAKEQELKQYQIYQTELQEKSVELEIYKQHITRLTEQRLDLQQKLDILNNKLNDGKSLGAAETLNHAIYNNTLKEVDDRLALTQKQLECVQKSLEAARLIYEEAHEKKLEAEREVAFSTIEVFCSTTALVGTFMSLTAIFAATTIASFGIAPAVLIFGGGLLGLGVKIFQLCDDHFGNRFTSAIRNFFTHAWQSFFGAKHENDYHLPLEKTNAPAEVKPGGSTGPLLQSMNVNTNASDVVDIYQDPIAVQIEQTLSSVPRLASPRLFDSIEVISDNPVIDTIQDETFKDESLKGLTPSVKVFS